jgi:transposase-like protein
LPITPPVSNTEGGISRVNARNMQKIANDLQYLGREDLEKLLLIIKEMLYSNRTDRQQLLKSLSERKFGGSLVCPYCSDTHVIRFGLFKERQRYRCRACGKTFSDYTWSQKILTALQKRYLEPFDAIVELDRTYSLHQITPLSKPAPRKRKSPSPNA